MSLVYGPNNLLFKGVSRRAVPTDAPDEAADTGDLRVLLCLVAAYGDTTKGNCVCTHRIQFPDSIEAGLEVTFLLCSSVFSSSRNGKLSVRARQSILHFAVESGLGPESFSVEMDLFTLRNADSAILEKVVRDPGRTTQVSLSSQALALLLDTYVLFGMTLSLILAFTLQRTEQRAIRRTDDTRVDGCLSGRR